MISIRAGFGNRVRGTLEKKITACYVKGVFNVGSVDV